MILCKTQQPATVQFAAIDALHQILSDYKQAVASPEVGPPPGVCPTVTNATPLSGVPLMPQQMSPPALQADDG